MQHNGSARYSRNATYRVWGKMLMDSNNHIEQIIAQLGFSSLHNVSGRNSIAEIFGKSKKRCGIYLLHFESNIFYIGQALDVVRRFGQHRNTYSDIIGFSFLPVSKQNLDEQERLLIQSAEINGLPITNRIHVSAIIGKTDLDSVLSDDEQSKWLDTKKEFNLCDMSSRVILPPQQYLRYSQTYARFLNRSDQKQVLELIKKYILLCVPACRRTEYSFWSLTCLPATNRSTWPRIAAVNINFMETFVIGHNIENPNTHWGFVNISKSIIEHQYSSMRGFQKKYPFVRFRERMYRAGGNDQITVEVSGLTNLSTILSDDTFTSAAGLLNLRLMRKGGTVYAKYHCPQLADAVLEQHAW
ncbi:hypothetical protein BH10CHL1_BH10CHL1_14440 [soil metagenome]